VTRRRPIEYPEFTFYYAPRHVVCFSGGHSSALVAIEVVRRYGRNGVVLLNHDINPRVARLVDAGLLIDDRSRIRAGLHLALRPLITTINEAIRPGSSMP
jgi:hypothetical protein